jgi:hypothetical protein
MSKLKLNKSYPVKDLDFINRSIDAHSRLWIKPKDYLWLFRQFITEHDGPLPLDNDPNTN